MYLYFYYLNDNSFEDLINEAIDSNAQVMHGILHQIFEQELYSKDEEKVNKSKHYILKFKLFDLLYQSGRVDNMEIKIKTKSGMLIPVLVSCEIIETTGKKFSDV